MLNLWSINWEEVKEILVYNPDKPLLFNSGLFLFLFTAFMLGYIFLSKHRTTRIAYLTLFSFYFYYKTSGLFLFLLLATLLFVYFSALEIEKSTSKNWKTTWLVLSVMVLLGLLGYYKYTNFFIEAWNSVSAREFSFHKIILPIGISFYTFQVLSYIIDVYRNQLKPVKNILEFSFFVTFFPHFVAGPIVRASYFIPQLSKEISLSKEDIGRALFLIAGGLLKKVMISDYISVNFVDRVFDQPEIYSGLENLFAVYGYAIQIYCDFSGYSDMAIGIALLTGYRLNENFRSPYQSASITEFWRRWHISLSSWLRDYLYIPLGGNKKGKFRQFLNLELTMLLGGLWHGASWRFVFWGGIHGLLLVIEKALGVTGDRGKSRVKLFFGTLLTFHLVAFLWIFFRADTFQIGYVMVGRIVTAFHPELFLQFINGYTIVLCMMITGYLLHFIPEKIEVKVKNVVGSWPVFMQSLALAISIWIAIQTMSLEIQPFIYFQF